MTDIEQSGIKCLRHKCFRKQSLQFLQRAVDIWAQQPVKFHPWYFDSYVILLASKTGHIKAMHVPVIWAHRTVSRAEKHPRQDDDFWSEWSGDDVHQISWRSDEGPLMSWRSHFTCVTHFINLESVCVFLCVCFWEEDEDEESEQIQ